MEQKENQQNKQQDQKAIHNNFQVIQDLEKKQKEELENQQQLLNLFQQESAKMEKESLELSLMLNKDFQSQKENQQQNNIVIKQLKENMDEKDKKLIIYQYMLQESIEKIEDLKLNKQNHQKICKEQYDSQTDLFQNTEPSILENQNIKFGSQQNQTSTNLKDQECQTTSLKIMQSDLVKILAQIEIGNQQMKLEYQNFQQKLENKCYNCKHNPNKLNLSQPHPLQINQSQDELNATYLGIYQNQKQFKKKIDYFQSESNSNTHSSKRFCKLNSNNQEKNNFLSYHSPMNGGSNSMLTNNNNNYSAKQLHFYKSLQDQIEFLTIQNNNFSELIEKQQSIIEIFKQQTCISPNFSFPQIINTEKQEQEFAKENNQENYQYQNILQLMNQIKQTNLEKEHYKIELDKLSYNNIQLEKKTVELGMQLKSSQLLNSKYEELIQITKNQQIEYQKRKINRLYTTPDQQNSQKKNLLLELENQSFENKKYFSTRCESEERDMQTPLKQNYYNSNEDKKNNINISNNNIFLSNQENIVSGNDSNKKQCDKQQLQKKTKAPFIFQVMKNWKFSKLQQTINQNNNFSDLKLSEMIIFLKMDKKVHSNFNDLQYETLQKIVENLEQSLQKIKQSLENYEQNSKELQQQQQSQDETFNSQNQVQGQQFGQNTDSYLNDKLKLQQKIGWYQSQLDEIKNSLLENNNQTIENLVNIHEQNISQNEQDLFA